MHQQITWALSATSLLLCSAQPRNQRVCPAFARAPSGVATEPSPPDLLVGPCGNPGDRLPRRPRCRRDLFPDADAVQGLSLRSGCQGKKADRGERARRYDAGEESHGGRWQKGRQPTFGRTLVNPTRTPAGQVLQMDHNFSQAGGAGEGPSLRCHVPARDQCRRPAGTTDETSIRLRPKRNEATEWQDENGHREGRPKSGRKPTVGGQCGSHRNLAANPRCRL
jgi:hypothetical protein